MSETKSPDHPDLPPSVWVQRFAPMAAAGGRVLDVACGSGRHARYFASRGHPVEAVDRNLGGFLQVPDLVNLRQADIEAEPWPYAGEKFAAVIVTNYLHRPLWATLVDAVMPGGVLIYETFALGNARYGRPTRADFLLQPEELLQVVRGHLEVRAFENVYVDSPKPAMVQRIVARRAMNPHESAAF